MENLTIVKNFEISELTKIYENSGTYTEGKLLKRLLDDSKTYIIETIFNLDDGRTKCIFADTKAIIMDKDQFNDMIYNRFPCKELKEWFKISPDIKFFKLSSEKSDCIVNYQIKKVFNTPIIKAKYSKYESFSEKAKYGCKLMLNHIKDINCGGDEIQSNYLLKLIKRMCLGVKNNVCVVIKTFGQGNGKSTFLKFLEQRVIGECNTCIGTSRMVLSGFNYPMYGKILVKFEELPCFSKEQYKGISGCFKNWITEDYINYEEKGKPSFDAYNCHTMFILSNNDCIDDDDGRRYFVIDHTNKFVDDETAKKKHFDTVYSNCFYDDVGNCFYSYLMDNINIDDKFDPNSQMPMTKNKIVSTAQKLAKPFIFIKEKYILKGLNINKKLKDLFQEYIDENKYYKMNIETFNKHLRESQLLKYISLSGGYYKIKASVKDLKEIYVKNNWISEFDEYESDSLDLEIQDNHANEISELKKIIEELQAENERLKNMKVVPIPKNEPEQKMTISTKSKIHKNIHIEEDIDELERQLSNIVEIPKQIIKKKPSITKPIKCHVIDDSDDDEAESQLNEEKDVTVEDCDMFLQLLNTENNQIVSK
jgi:hypothetical protein